MVWTLSIVKMFLKVAYIYQTISWKSHWTVIYITLGLFPQKYKSFHKLWCLISTNTKQNGSHWIGVSSTFRALYGLLWPKLEVYEPTLHYFDWWPCIQTKQFTMSFQFWIYFVHFLVYTVCYKLSLDHLIFKTDFDQNWKVWDGKGCRRNQYSQYNCKSIHSPFMINSILKFWNIGH